MDTATLTVRYNELKSTLTPEVRTLIEDLLKALDMSEDLIVEILSAYERERSAHDRLLAIL